MEHAAENDVRTQRTKAAIRNALEEMIVEMDAHRITVSELTKRAGIHRKTFYLHYETIEDLFYEQADNGERAYEARRDPPKDFLSAL